MLIFRLAKLQCSPLVRSGMYICQKNVQCTTVIGIARHYQPRLIERVWLPRSPGHGRHTVSVFVMTNARRLRHTATVVYFRVYLGIRYFVGPVVTATESYATELDHRVFRPSVVESAEW